MKKKSPKKFTLSEVVKVYALLNRPKFTVEFQDIFDKQSTKDLQDIFSFVYGLECKTDDREVISMGISLGLSKNNFSEFCKVVENLHGNK